MIKFDCAWIWSTFAFGIEWNNIINNFYVFLGFFQVCIEFPNKHDCITCTGPRSCVDE
jgi:hypothetical protein